MFSSVYSSWDYNKRAALDPTAYLIKRVAYSLDTNFKKHTAEVNRACQVAGLEQKVL